MNAGDLIGNYDFKGMADAEIKLKNDKLRDSFALGVAGHIWTQFQQDGTARDHSEWRQGVAVEAYRLADEMIKERNK